MTGDQVLVPRDELLAAAAGCREVARAAPVLMTTYDPGPAATREQARAAIGFAEAMLAMTAAWLPIMRLLSDTQPASGQPAQEAVRCTVCQRLSGMPSAPCRDCPDFDGERG